MSVILLNSRIVHYEVLGRGRPLILLHGWVGSWRYWIPVMQAASVQYRAYALDLWGFGDSYKSIADYTLQSQVGLLEGFLEQLGIGRVALVGHGLGGLVAMKFALQNPDRVDRIMAVSVPMDSKMINRKFFMTDPAAMLAATLGQLSSSEPLRADISKTDPVALQVSLEEIDGIANLRECWKSLRTPCLIVSGQKDQAVEPFLLEQHESLPDTAHAISFDLSGHFPMLEESSKFNRLMVDYLSLPSGESPRELQLKEEWKRRVR